MFIILLFSKNVFASVNTIYNQSLCPNKYFIYVVLIVCQVENYWKYLKLSWRSFALTLYKTFLKNRNRSGTSLPAPFYAWFLKKNISVVPFYYLTKFQYLAVFTSWDIGQYVYSKCLLTGIWGQKFEINLIFLIKPFFIHDQNVKTKI